MGFGDFFRAFGRAATATGDDAIGIPAWQRFGSRALLDVASGRGLLPSLANTYQTRPRTSMRADDENDFEQFFNTGADDEDGQPNGVPLLPRRRRRRVSPSLVPPAFPLPEFGRGGRLRRPGDAALVGDHDGGQEELAVKVRGGDTIIVPLPPRPAPEGVGAMGSAALARLAPEALPPPRAELMPPSAAPPRQWRFDRDAKGGLIIPDEVKAQLSASVRQIVSGGLLPVRPPAVPLAALEGATYALPEPQHEPQMPAFSARVDGRELRGEVLPPVDALPERRERVVSGEPVTLANPSALLPPRARRGAPMRPNTGDYGADTAAHMENLYRYGENVRDNNGRLKSTLIGFGRGFIEGGGLVGGIANAIHHAADPSQDERYHNRREIAQTRGEVGEYLGRRKAEVGLEQDAAQTRLYDAQGKYWRDQKPRELDARLLRQSRNEVLAELRAKKGTKLSPDDPLIAKAAAVDMEIDVDAFNNAASNAAGVTLVDPMNPTQTRRMMFNKVTGALADVGQSGYVAPRGPDGLTEFERQQVGFRRDSLNLQADRLDLDTQKWLRDVESGITGSAKAAFDVEAGPLMKILLDKQGDVRQWKADFAANKIPYDRAAEQIKQLEGEIASVQGQIADAQKRALAGRGVVPPPARRGGAAPAGRRQSPASPAQPSGGRVKRSAFRAQNPQYKDASDAEVDRVLSGLGLRGY